jgi:sensor histidine kinase YesM
MDRNSEFSVYPSLTVRVALHILYWVLMLFFILVITSYSFRVKVFDSENVLFSCAVLFSTLFIHYFVCYFSFNHIRTKKWLLVLLDIFVVYALSVLVTTSALTLLKHLHPGNAVVERLHQRFAVNSIARFFSGELVIWIFSFIIWFNAIGIIIKIAKDFYESSLEKFAIAQEKNSMEINFLRAQIQPHFLFNSLNSIYGLVLENEEASKVILQLSNLLRFSLYDSAREYITLREEVDFLTNYIILERMRHKESLVQIEYDFNQVENCEKTIKPLILINFIENAFKHGINASVKNRWVKLVMEEKDGLLTFRVANNKPPVTSRKKNMEQSGGGLGLKNVRRRLELEYHTRYSLDIKETEEMYEVVLVIKL